MRLGLDIMGGDFAPKATIDGAIQAKKDLGGSVNIVLYGDETIAKQTLSELGGDPDAFEFVHTTQVIGMDEHPAKALKVKTDSSILRGYLDMRQRKLDAFCSAGNTGAMLVGAVYTVRNIPGIIRAGIASLLPKSNGGTGIIIDVGANADSKPDILHQHAILGKIYAENILQIKEPKVGLLNIGEEEEKGNLLTLAAHKLMKDNPEYNFIGNIESRSIFDEDADVVVCDGFTGNVILKLVEGMYTVTRKRGIQDDFLDRFNYEEYGGMPILGVDGNVIIGHGISNGRAIKNMIMHSYECAKSGLANQIQKALNDEQ